MLLVMEARQERTFFQWLVQFLFYLAKNSSVHGFHYLTNNQITKAERVGWCLIVVASSAYSYYFFASNLHHFLANPTVVTIEKDFRNWQNPFPAATACYVNRVNESRAKTFIENTWGVKAENDKFIYYFNFISTVSNLTYKTFDTLKPFAMDRSLVGIDWLTLIEKVHPNVDESLVTFENKNKPQWQLVVTEFGLCFTLNSKFAALFSPRYKNNFNIQATPRIMKCHYLNGLCYARYDSDASMPLMYYIHSSLDMIHATSEPPILLGKSEEYEVNYKLAQTYSLDDIRYLAPQQRKCRFHDEPLTINVPVYSTSVCTMECRYKLVMTECGCKPFYYTFLEGKQCDLKDLLCLSKISHLLNQSTSVFGCECPQPCDLMVYLKQIPKITTWDQQFFDERNTFRWGLMSPTTKYHRKILFGLQELIVSLGGALSLFLGISLISVVETVYLTLEFLFYVLKSQI